MKNRFTEILLEENYVDKLYNQMYTTNIKG
jgi:hypothetical protein